MNGMTTPHKRGTEETPQRQTTERKIRQLFQTQETRTTATSATRTRIPQTRTPKAQTVESLTFGHQKLFLRFRERKGKKPQMFRGSQNDGTIEPYVPPTGRCWTTALDGGETTSKIALQQSTDKLPALECWKDCLKLNPETRSLDLSLHLLCHKGVVDQVTEFLQHNISSRYQQITLYRNYMDAQGILKPILRAIARNTSFQTVRFVMIPRVHQGDVNDGGAALLRHSLQHLRRRKRQCPWQFIECLDCDEYFVQTLLEVMHGNENTLWGVHVGQHGRQAISESTCLALAALVATSFQLQRLHVTGTLTARGMDYLVAAVAMCNENKNAYALQEITLSCTTTPSGEHQKPGQSATRIPLLLEKASPTLRRLSVTGHVWKSHDLDTLARLIQRQQRQQSAVGLQHLQLIVEPWQASLLCIPGCNFWNDILTSPALQTLHLEGMDLSQQTWTAVSRDTTPNQLTELALLNCGLTLHHGIALLRQGASPSCRHLTFLHLELRRTQDNTITHLFDAMTFCFQRNHPLRNLLVRLLSPLDSEKHQGEDTDGANEWILLEFTNACTVANLELHGQGLQHNHWQVLLNWIHALGMIRVMQWHFRLASISSDNLLCLCQHFVLTSHDKLASFSLNWSTRLDPQRDGNSLVSALEQNQHIVHIDITRAPPLVAQGSQFVVRRNRVLGLLLVGDGKDRNLTIPKALWPWVIARTGQGNDTSAIMFALRNGVLESILEPVRI